MEWFKQVYKVDIDVIGAPCWFGQCKEGVSEGPTKMREHGLIQQIQNMGLKVNDKGNLKFSDHGTNDLTVHNVRKPKSVGYANKLIADAVEDSIKKDHFCVTLGGDHCIAIGSIAGHARVQPDLAVIWVDAHADINPPLASHSGNSHGMPLSFLLHELVDYIPKGIPGFEWVEPCLHAKDIAYIALRDLDDAEKEIIEKFQIKAFTMNDVTALGIATVVKKAIDHVAPSQCRPIHLSFDIDALDPSEATSTGTPVPGGLSLREGIYITETVGATGFLQMMDMAEVNPCLGTPTEQTRTLQSACEIIGGCFGKRNRKLITPGYSIPRP